MINYPTAGYGSYVVHLLSSYQFSKFKLEKFVTTLKYIRYRLQNP